MGSNTYLYLKYSEARICIFVFHHYRSKVFVFILDQYIFMYLIKIQPQVKYTFCMALQARKIVVAN